LTTFEKLSNLGAEFRFEFRFDNFRKVVKSGSGISIWISIWQLSKSCQIWGRNFDLTTFEKLSNLVAEFRFDNFRKVVKSGGGISIWISIWQLSKSCQIWKRNFDLTTFEKLSNLVAEF